MAARWVAAPGPDPTAPLWRALAVYRAATVVYVVVAYLLLDEYYARREVGWVVVAALAAWTLLVTLRYRAASGRTPALLVADLAVAVVAIAANPLVDDPGRIEAGEPTLALIWPSGALLAWAVQWGWRGGLAASAVLGGASILARGELTRSTGNNVLLMVLAGAIVGYAVDLFRRSQEALADAVRLDAATRERERLARSIHDGVLQVLALVQRRAPQWGAEGAELARLATEQQDAVRGLLLDRPVAGGASVDLATELRLLDGGSVSVAAPADPVLLPEPVARELLAAVAECLSNVRRHVGEDAPAWVLLDADDDEVRVSIRDEGPGIPEGRLGAAEEAGRLGLAQSVIGRIRDLGGSAEVTSAPGQGTEVELTVPRASAS